MQRLMTLLLGLMLAGSYLTSTAAPGPTAGVQPPSQHARGHDDGGGGNRVNVERKKKNKKKNKKRKKSKAPTCFGLPATIDEHSGEIAGTDFDDVIIGDAGANTVVSGDGIGRICTGGGGDRVSLDDDQAGDAFVELGPGNDFVVGKVEGSNVLLGGDGSDQLFGGNENDELRGGAGDDILGGKGGRDLLSGGDGNDDLRGGEDNDNLFGDAGSDFIFGDNDDNSTDNDGVDTLDGGDGVDACQQDDDGVVVSC